MKRQVTIVCVATLSSATGCTDASPEDTMSLQEDAGSPEASVQPSEAGRTDGSEADAGFVSDAALGEPYRLSIEVPGVGSGVEGTKCLKIRLDNAEAFKVGRIHNTLSTASHHLVVSAVEDATETEEPLFDCSPFRAVLIGAPLTVTQKHDDVILMPEGVGFPLESEQLMHLEMHYLNTGSDTADVRADVELFPLRDEGPIAEASFLIVGDLGISIPPLGTHRMDRQFVSLPDDYEGVQFYAATGHTHRFGTGARLGVGENASDDGTTVYDPPGFDWAEPELKFFTPPFQVPAGGGFNFDCAWDNPTNETLGFGESALDEMCFFWAYYYPRRDGDRTLLTVSGSGEAEDAGTAPDAE